MQRSFEDVIWEAGPEAVAKEIERIRAAYLAEKTAIGPDAVFNEDTQRFNLKYDASPDQSSVEFVVQRTELALENAIEAGHGNGVTERSIEVVMLRRAITRHRGDASHLATAFLDARATLEHNLQCGEYPDDPSLTILSNTLFANKEELCERDPEARVRCDRLEALAPPKTIPALDRDDALAAPEIVKELVDIDAKFE